jgi:pSer/pThr/pTyr-binding forkhead associated (FHA) protein
MRPIMSETGYASTFTVTLSPLTALCVSKIYEGFSTVNVQKFPFRIGRGARDDRNVESSQNDIDLMDAEPFQVSRKHCHIEREGDCFYVRDSGSSLGTIVNGSQIGVRHASLSEMLKPGKNHIILGTIRSPFKFVIEISEEL